MTTYELSHELYKWLSGLEIVPGNHRYKSSGNFQLDQKTVDMLISGYSIANLVNIIATQKGINMNGPLLSSVKNSNTPAARIYNWNILQQSLTKINISLPKQTQKDITSGNFHTLVRFLLKIKQQVNSSKKSEQTKKQRQEEQVEVDLKKTNSISNANEAQSALQLIVFLIAKYFGLNFKQAVSTLSQNGRYFAHIVVKGLKGSFTQVYGLYQNINKQLPQIVYLSQKNPQKNTQFMIEILKPSLISREQQVAKIGAITFGMFVQQSLKYNSKNLIYQILCKQSVGFDFIYMGTKRHPTLADEIYSFVYQLAHTSYHDFFAFQLKKAINDQSQYLRTIITLLPSIVKQQNSKALALESKTVQTWISLCKQTLKYNNKPIKQETKLLYLELLSQLWKHYHKQFQTSHENQDLLMRVIQELKKNTRKQNYTIKIPALLRLFDLLEHLAERKNHIAALIYKKIIFLFIQNHHDPELRQVILDNFGLILHKFPTIPLQFLMQPLLKQITTKQGKSYIMNVFDFEFMLKICQHPKMDISYALSFLEYFTKLYMKSIIYANPVFRIIQAVTDRFCEEQVLRDFLVKNTIENLNHYGMIIFGRKKMAKQQIIINNQKKSLIIELIKHYINLSHSKLNEEIQQHVLNLYVKWLQEKNYKDKGLQSLLMMLGDIDQMVMKVEQQKYQKKQKIVKETIQREQRNKSTYRDSIQYEPQIRSIQMLSDNITKKNAQHKVRKGYTPDIFTPEDKGDFFKQKGLGYKKRSVDKADRMNILIANKKIKPDPKALVELQKIRQKVKMQEYKKIMSNQATQKKNKEHLKMASKQLLQRNISLGYSKLPQIQQDKILFEFDTVKTKHLKQDPHFIHLQLQEDRQQESVKHILEKNKQYVKIIYNKYACASAADKKKVVGEADMVLSFTEIIRMLKDKGLSRIPKISVNEAMSIINHKRRKQSNVLGGIYQQDFGNLLIQLTYILNIVDKGKKDQPFGLKLQNFIRLLLEGQKLTKDLDDPKILKYKAQANKNSDQSPIPIPQGYKKSKEVDLQLIYSLGLVDSNVNQSFLDCFDIVDYIYEKAMKAHLLAPWIEYVQKKTIVPVQRFPKPKMLSQSSQKPLKTPEQLLDNVKQNDNLGEQMSPQKAKNAYNYDLKPKKNKNTFNQKKSLSSAVLHKQVDPILQQQNKKKQQSRQKYLQELKEKLIQMKQQKNEQELQKKKQKEQAEKKLKMKQQSHKKYLEDNKKKIQSHREKKERDNSQKKAQEEKKKQEEKDRIKLKEAQLLEKEKERIRLKAQARQQIKKNKQENTSPVKNQKLANQVLKKLSERKNQKFKEIALKHSIQNGELSKVLQQYEKPLNQLYQGYWTWDKKKIQLNSLALLLRDFHLSPQYLLPKTIAQIFKTVSKGMPLDFNGFKQCIARLAYKSQKLEQQIGSGENKKQQKNSSQQGQNKIDERLLQLLLQKLHMKQPNYKQVVHQTKQHLA